MTLLNGKKKMIGTMPAARSARRPHLSWLPFALLAILLAVQAALSLRLIGSNTAFDDEALYLWSGHMEIASSPAAISFPGYFSGAPVIYPPLGAAADAIGGLTGARLLSLAFMLGTTVLLYVSALRLFRSHAAALGAAAVFVLLAPVQFLSAFATYDAMALFLLAASACLVIVASSFDGADLILIVAGLVLALADATKYATALWDPVIIALVIILAAEDGWLHAVLRGARTAAYVAVPLVIAVLIGGHPYVTGIRYSTLDRQPGIYAPSLILHDSLAWLWPVLILALAAMAVSFTDTLRSRLLCCLLALALLLAPLHQAQIHTLTSLDKHTAFGAWFGAIAAGYLIARLTRYLQDHHWYAGWRLRLVCTATAAAVLAVSLAGILQAGTLYQGGWPNSAKAVAATRSQLHVSKCPCLMMSNTVMSYYLLGTIPLAAESSSLTGPYYFQYHGESGTPAYVQAIRNHYFQVAEIDIDADPVLAAAVQAALASTQGYHLEDTAPWSSTTYKGTAKIWRYVPPGKKAGQ